MRDLHQDARSIASERIRPNGATVFKIEEDLEAVRNNLVAFDTFDIGDEAKAARIALLRGMIKPLLFGKAEWRDRAVTWMHLCVGHGANRTNLFWSGERFGCS